jgi:hypothetical protein
MKNLKILHFDYKSNIVIIINFINYNKLKKIINQHNHLLYAVPYQHFTNFIENYFSMLKSRL